MGELRQKRKLSSTFTSSLLPSSTNAAADDILNANESQEKTKNSTNEWSMLLRSSPCESTRIAISKKKWDAAHWESTRECERRATRDTSGGERNLEIIDAVP